MATCSTGEAKEREGVLFAAPAGHLLECSCFPLLSPTCPWERGSLWGKAFPGSPEPLDGWGAFTEPTGWLSEGWCPISPAELVCRAQGSGRKGESSWGRSLASRRVSWGREQTGWRGGMDRVAWYLRGLDRS